MTFPYVLPLLADKGASHAFAIQTHALIMCRACLVDKDTTTDSFAVVSVYGFFFLVFFKKLGLCLSAVGFSLPAEALNHPLLELRLGSE